MWPYIKIARPDHWIKQLFILPGVALGILLAGNLTPGLLVYKVILALVSTSFIASANYVINEWLDREFDQYHPIKKNRPAVTVGLKGSVVWAEWAVLSVLGILCACLVNPLCAITEGVLWIMGLLYNVKPFRTKDVVYLDVISESLNNALRLLIGWFAVCANLLPPSSVVIGYWMAGAYLMAIKRFSEYRSIGNPEVAALYRKSFGGYTSKSLLQSSFFYAIISVFLVGVFMVKYHIEYLLFIPFLCMLYVIYLGIAFKEDSAAQAPEKLYKEKWLMVYVGFLIAIFIVLTFIKMPFLSVFLDTVLIGV